MTALDTTTAATEAETRDAEGEAAPTTALVPAPLSVPPSPSEAPLLNPAYGDASAMIAAIARLESVLDHETLAIGRLSTAELKELNRRKSLCLLEFTRAAKPLAEQTVSVALRVRLERLRDAIARNQAVLTTHLDAVREIAGTIAGALEAREHDGTYSQGARLGSAGR